MTHFRNAASLSLLFALVSFEGLSCKARVSQLNAKSSETSESEGGLYQDEAVEAFMARDSDVSAKNPHMDFTNKKINGAEMFNRGPLALAGSEKMPFVIFRILPEFAEKLTGKPVFGRPGEEFAEYGFFYDGRKPNWPAPLGFTWSVPNSDSPSQIAYEVRTCASCHVARLKIGTKTHYLEGAPNIEMDFHAFGVAWADFLGKAFDKDNRAKSKAIILSLLKSKSPDWFFNNESSFSPSGDKVAFDAQKSKEQLQLVVSNIDAVIDDMIKANDIRKAVNDGTTQIFNRAAGDASKHQRGDFGPAGILDSNTNGILTMVFASNERNKADPAKIFDVNKLFPGATKVSIPSVWQQNRRKAAQWTANVRQIFFRNAVAALGFVDSPRNINGLHIEMISNYIADLPAPKFPAQISTEKAEAGKKVYEAASCGECHIAVHQQYPDVFKMGTSRNRMLSSVPGLGAVVAPELFSTCLANADNMKLEVTIDGALRKPCQVDFKTVMAQRDSEDNTGYPAMPLDGVWARAPYLHNGSVPTLYHLLAFSGGKSLRPRRFMTGSTQYDLTKIGWLWNEDTTVDGRSVYDVSLDGFSNRGHEGADAKGFWKDPKSGKTFKLSWNVDDPEDASALNDLLEYLKSL